MTDNVELKLNLYDKKLSLIDSTTNIIDNIGTVIIHNLTPNSSYGFGEFFISWNVKGKELNKFPIQEFITQNNENKKIIKVKFNGTIPKDSENNNDSNKENSNLSNGKSAYEIALDNGFVGSEKEWLEYIRGEPGKDGKSFTPSDLTNEDYKKILDYGVENGFFNFEPPTDTSNTVVSDTPPSDTNKLWINITGGK